MPLEWPIPVGHNSSLRGPLSNDHLYHMTDAAIDRTSWRLCPGHHLRKLHVVVVLGTCLILQVSQQDWDSLVTAQEEVNPFLKWTFLHILEASGSAVRPSGQFSAFSARTWLDACRVGSIKFFHHRLRWRFKYLAGSIDLRGLSGTIELIRIAGKQ